MAKRSDLESETASIGDFTRDELAARWCKIYGCPPPPGVRRELLSYAVAWDLQAKRLGGFSAETRKRLKLAITNVARKNSSAKSDNLNVDHGFDTEPSVSAANSNGKQAPSRSAPRPGARLIREWNGRANVVDVVKDGFLFEGQSYRSLSAIAYKITNAHWSGPRFFGL